MNLTKKQRQTYAKAFREIAEKVDLTIEFGLNGYICSEIYPGYTKIYNFFIELETVLSSFFPKEVRERDIGWWHFKDRHARVIACLLIAEVLESGLVP